MQNCITANVGLTVWDDIKSASLGSVQWGRARSLEVIMIMSAAGLVNVH